MMHNEYLEVEMLKIEEYQIVSGDLHPYSKETFDEETGKITIESCFSLEELVNAEIAQGWRIHGAPFPFNDGICQAMVKFANI